MAKRKEQPETPDDARDDSTASSRQAKIDDIPTVRFGSVDMRGMVPRELESEALFCGGAHGYSKAEIIRAAIANWVGDPRTQAVKNSFLKRKMAQHNMNEYEVYARVLEAYRRTARDRRGNLEETSDES